MTETVKKYIKEEKIFNPDAKIIVGLSGGADSSVLLHILQHLGYECIAAHCNFHLRGEESCRDEYFSMQTANSLQIPFFKRDFDTAKMAKERKVSIEMMARDLRYQWFEELRKELDADAIAVAHHRNDSIETLLLNLIRGTGIAGLTGIKSKSGYIVRPLLCVSKDDIMQYAEKENLPFVTDSSNLQDEYTRNKIRLQLLPLLQSLNPGLDLSLLRTMEHLNEVAKIYYTHIENAKKEIFNPYIQTISIHGLLSCTSPESVLFEILKEYGFGKDTVKSVYQAIESPSGKEFYSAGYRLIKDREYFLLFPVQQDSENSIFHISESETNIYTPFRMNFVIQDNCPEILSDKRLAYFDFEKLKFPLTLRKWQKGDRFVPFGMKGSQKLSDYFNNHKINKHEKENTWLLCSDKNIIWVVGKRADNRFKIERDTKKFIIFKLL
jgi:tRNA(Ile)-lysidine synthase